MNSPFFILKSFSLLFLVVRCCTVVAFASWQNELSLPTVGSFPAMQKETTLNYAVSWNNWVKAGNIALKFYPQGNKQSSHFVVTSKANSTGFASTLFPYQHFFFSEINAKDIKPIYFQSQEKDKKEDILTKVWYSNGQAEIKEETYIIEKKKKEVTHIVFKQEPIFDIFSAMLWIRSQSLHKGQELNVVVQPFCNPYLVTIQSEGKTRHEGVEAIHLLISMRKIDRHTKQLKSYKKLSKQAHMWLSSDANRIPLELRAQVFVGNIRVMLKR